jgi:hypothetical protein
LGSAVIAFCAAARARELALPALVVAFAHEFAGARERRNALCDRVGERGGGAGIAVRRGEAPGHPGTLIDDADVGDELRTLFLERAGDVRVDLEESRELPRLLIVEQTVARETGRAERFTQLVLGHHHHLALGARREPRTYRVGELHARGRIRGRCLKRQNQKFFLRFLSRRELSGRIPRDGDHHRCDE